MGYCITQQCSDFFLKKENQEAAFRAAVSLAKKHYSWVGADWSSGLKNIEDVLTEWRYEPIIDDNEDIIGVEFSGEKLGDEIELFKAIAPFVEKGSYIEMSGEDSCLWRWVFDGKTCKEVYAKISWE
jgi:hypothetical protein